MLLLRNFYSILIRHSQKLCHHVSWCILIVVFSSNIFDGIMAHWFFLNIVIYTFVHNPSCISQGIWTRVSLRFCHHEPWHILSVFCNSNICAGIMAPCFCFFFKYMYSKIQFCSQLLLHFSKDFDQSFTEAYCRCFAIQTFLVELWPGFHCQILVK